MKLPKVAAKEPTGRLRRRFALHSQLEISRDSNMVNKGSAYFTPASFKFLRGLARNNNREWFANHKTEFETQLRDPYLRLIADLAEPLRGISPHYVADPKPVGGSLFRIYRDTRFASDKTPYKTWAGARFSHERSRELMGEAPVFYLHVEPGNNFIGGGLWHPGSEALRRVRDYLVNNPASWKSATRSVAFRKQFELDGDSLSRPPRGYDPAHELIDDIKRKDFVCTTALDDDTMLSPQLPKVLIKHYKAAAPMVDWLCGALDLDF
jgi:uncharacterized protein (TIGR02453 family)